MKLRLISDLHLDINRNYDVKIPNGGKDAFTLIAGDLGGDYKKNAEWLRENVSHGAFISGNHDAYVPHGDITPLDDVKEFYHKEFPENGNVIYMDNDVGVISHKLDDNTILVADVMYTDYKLPFCDSMKSKKAAERVSINMDTARPGPFKSYMNDFRFLTRKSPKHDKSMAYTYLPPGMYYIEPEMYKEHFDKTFRNITKIVEENSDKNIVLMTHHCLSKNCISGNFSKSTLNASYVSDKDSWIKKHPNIKLILSGHVHHRDSFKVGSALYVLNPLGYIPYGDHIILEDDKRISWSPNCIVDTDNWTMTYDKNHKIGTRNG